MRRFLTCGCAIWCIYAGQARTELVVGLLQWTGKLPGAQVCLNCMYRFCVCKFSLPFERSKGPSCNGATFSALQKSTWICSCSHHRDTLGQNPAMEDSKVQFASSLFMVLRARSGQKGAPGSEVTMTDIASSIGVRVMEVFQVRS